MCLGAGVKTAGVHGGHGVVEKKQSVFKRNVIKETYTGCILDSSMQ